MLIVRAPFRVSFFGGGTDFHDYYAARGGQVLSTTIDKYCFVTLRHLPPYFAYRNQATYSVIERFNECGDIRHPLIRAALSHIPTDRVQIAYDSDLPARSGIGSSSAFAVALLKGLHAMHGEQPDRERLAREAIYLERVLCGEFGGEQDQIAAAYGGLNRIVFSADGFRVQPLEIPAERKRRLQDSLLLAFTGFTHFSGVVAEEQQKNIPDKTAQLDEIKALVDAGTDALAHGDLDDFGRLLHREWELKKTLSSKITTAEIDDLYRRFRAAGAVGGKLLGAGSGGYFLLYAPPERQKALREALPAITFVPFAFEDSGVRTLYESTAEHE